MGACDAGMMALNASPVQQPSWAPPDMATSSGLEVVESSAGPLDMDHVRLAAALPTTLPSSLSTKDGSMLGNQKAEVFALAHRGRVEAEAAAYLEAETRKTEAHAQTLQARAEQRRMRVEAKALERRKREEQRAELAVHNAKVRAQKIVSKALEDELRIKAKAHEEAERTIADSQTRAEQEKAEAEETRKRNIAELNDRAQQLVALGVLPSRKSDKASTVLYKLINRHFTD